MRWSASTRTNRAASARRAARAAIGSRRRSRACSTGAAWSPTSRCSRRPRRQMTGLNLCALGDSIEPFLGSVDRPFRGTVPRLRQGHAADAGSDAPSIARICMPKDVDRSRSTASQVTVPEGTLIVEAAKQIRPNPGLLLSSEARAGRPVPHLPGRHREDAQAADRVQHDRSPKAWSSTRMNEGSTRAGARCSSSCCSNHPLDCPICDKGGECDLQDFSMAYGQGASRLADAKENRSPRRSISARRSCSTKSAASCACAACASTRSSRRRAVAAHRRPRRARDHRDRDRRAVPLRFQRQRDRALSGRRADVEDVSLQVAPVGQPPHADDRARSAASAAR